MSGRGPGRQCVGGHQWRFDSIATLAGPGVSDRVAVGQRGDHGVIGGNAHELFRRRGGRWITGGAAGSIGIATRGWLTGEGNDRDVAAHPGWNIVGRHAGRRAVAVPPRPACRARSGAVRDLRLIGRPVGPVVGGGLGWIVVVGQNGAVDICGRDAPQHRGRIMRRSDWPRLGGISKRRAVAVRGEWDEPVVSVRFGPGVAGGSSGQFMDRHSARTGMVAGRTPRPVHDPQRAGG